jgi:O-methyltransferase involved in polyketide biosynthesis
MKNEQAKIAHTAYRVMFYVALEQYQPDPCRIIHDDLARQMLPSHIMKDFIDGEKTFGLERLYR